jgi:hypothetical protein
MVLYVANLLILALLLGFIFFLVWAKLGFGNFLFVMLILKLQKYPCRGVFVWQAVMSRWCVLRFFT